MKKIISVDVKSPPVARREQLFNDMALNDNIFVNELPVRRNLREDTGQGCKLSDDNQNADVQVNSIVA
jgi:hypothetical protein